MNAVHKPEESGEFGSYIPRKKGVQIRDDLGNKYIATADSYFDRQTGLFWTPARLIRAASSTSDSQSRQ